jgi:hypothetical protein
MNRLIYIVTEGLIAICITLSLNGCTIRKPTFSDFIGTWVTNNGDQIILKEDSSFVAKNMKDPNSYPDTLPQYFAGKWNFEISDTYEKHIITLDSESLDYTEWFFISGHGLFRNKPPWYFFQYIGDPDLLDEYAFRKIE